MRRYCATQNGSEFGERELRARSYIPTPVVSESDLQNWMCAGDGARTEGFGGIGPEARSSQHPEN